jgi:hypothetical protein
MLRVILSILFTSPGDICIWEFITLPLLLTALLALLPPILLVGVVVGCLKLFSLVVLRMDFTLLLLFDICLERLESVLISVWVYFR